MGKYLNPLEKEFLIRQYKSNPITRAVDGIAERTVVMLKEAKYGLMQGLSIE